MHVAHIGYAHLTKLHCAALAQAPQKEHLVLHWWSIRDENLYAPQSEFVQDSMIGHCVFVGTIIGLLRHNRLWTYPDGTLFHWIQRETWQIKTHHLVQERNITRPKLRWVDRNLFNGYLFKPATWVVISSIMQERKWQKLVLPCLSWTDVMIKYFSLKKQVHHQQQAHKELQTTLQNQALATESFQNKWQMAGQEAHAFVAKTSFTIRGFCRQNSPQRNVLRTIFDGNMANWDPMSMHFKMSVENTLDKRIDA